MHKETGRSKATPEQRAKARDGRLNHTVTNDVRRGPPKRAQKVTSPPSKAGAKIAIPDVNVDVSRSGKFVGHDLDAEHQIRTYGSNGVFATPGPGSRAVDNSLAAAVGQRDHVTAPPVTGGFLPDGPIASSALPVSVALASENTAPASRDRVGGNDRPSSRSNLPPLPRKAYKF
jgi:hypothetical protein